MENKRQKTILILGAGVYQVPLIKRARERGLRTIVASIPGNYPAYQLVFWRLKNYSYSVIFFNFNCARLRHFETAQQTCKCRFSAAVITDNSNIRALFNAKRDIGKGRLITLRIFKV